MEKNLTSPHIKAKRLAIGFSRDRVLNTNPWDFEIASGALVALIGPNGSGKTSLLRALMGDQTFVSGEVLLGSEKESIEKWNCRRLARNISYLPQESFFDPLQTIESYLKLAFLAQQGLFHRLSNKNHSELKILIHEFGFKDVLNKRLQDLSSGERQRVFLGRALLQPSAIALLDEPTNHLDPNVCEQMWKVLAAQKGKKTLVVATHDLANVERHCDQVIVLSKNDLMFSGLISDFLSLKIKHQVFPLIG